MSYRWAPVRRSARRLGDQFTSRVRAAKDASTGTDNIPGLHQRRDYVFRVLGIEYLDRTDLGHIVTESLQGGASPKKHAAESAAL